MSASKAGTFVVPGIGTFVDASGNTWSISTGGTVIQNGKIVPGGGGTGMAIWFNGVVYGQDAKSALWYIWNGKAWTSAPTAPPAPKISGVTVATIPGQRVGASFPVHGTFQITPAPLIATDSSTNVSIKPEAVSYTFTHPAFKAGTHTVSVTALGVTATSNAFKVS